MTGLAGVLSLGHQLEPSDAAATLARMAHAQRHRAPRGWSTVIRRQFAHIIPKPPAEVQLGPPFPPHPGTDDLPPLDFDGVLTNRAQILDQLHRVGVTPRCDCDAVRFAWKQWGPDALSRLDGRFGFVLHDPGEGAFYLVRDPFGNRPLYYLVGRGVLYYASEIKPLLAVAGPPDLDTLALIEWSLYGDVLPPRTLFGGVRALAPGSFVRVPTNGLVDEPCAYYDPAQIVDPIQLADCAARPIPEFTQLLEEAIEKAVRSHIDGRSDVGVMLSGGVDSAVIAALAARCARLRAYNFSIANNPLLDERPMAGVVARHLGLPLEGVAVDGDTYRRELAPTTYHYEMPLWHMQGVPYRLLALHARQDNVGMLLSGNSVGPWLGAAADRIRWILPSPLLDRVPENVFRVVRKAVYAASGLPVANPFLTLNLGIGIQLVDGGARARMIRRHEQAYAFLTDVRKRRAYVMRMTDNVLFQRRINQQGDSLCMAAAVEYCDAALTREFQKLAFNTPVGLMHRKGKWKWILKELATRYVPREVAFQKKIPLDVPAEEYFAPQFKASLFRNGFLASFLGMGWNNAQEVVATARDRTPALVRLVNLETWGRLFFLEQSVEQVTDLLTR